MFKVTKIGSNRLDLTLDGKLTSEQMTNALDELAEKSRGISDGKMLYRVVNFNLPTLGAIGVEFSRLPALFTLVRQFSRAAVLTDRGWLKTASELEGYLFPGLEIKAFDLDQVAEAEAWLDQ